MIKQTAEIFEILSKGGFISSDPCSSLAIRVLSAPSSCLHSLFCFLCGPLQK